MAAQSIITGGRIHDLCISGCADRRGIPGLSVVKSSRRECEYELEAYRCQRLDYQVNYYIKPHHSLGCLHSSNVRPRYLLSLSVFTNSWSPARPRRC